MRKTALALLSLLTLLLTLTAGCTAPAAASPGSLPAPCARFVARYGGAGVFGLVLWVTPPNNQGERLAYLYAGVLHCPAQGEPAFAPLGERLLAEPVETPPPIAEAIAPWVRRHGGEAIFGPPLSPPRYNQTRGRWEQVFRNLVVAWSEDQPPHLLPLGALACGAPCLQSFQGDQAWLPEPVATLPAAVAATLVQLGGLEVSGPLLRPPFAAPQSDALLFVFRNLVLAYHPDTRQAAPWPVVRLYGLGHADPPIPFQQWPNHTFFTVDAEQTLGYPLPAPFAAFLEQRGGLDFLCGQPISLPRLAPDGHLEQWCENIGLYTPTDTWAVRLRPVGEAFLTWLQEHPQPTPIPSNLRVFVHAPSRVALNETVTWQVDLRTDLPDPQPVPNHPVRLEVPDLAYFAQAVTDAQGRATFTLTLDNPALVGRNLRYRACALDPGSQSVLACSEEFVLLVWR